MNPKNTKRDNKSKKKFKNSKIENVKREILAIPKPYVENPKEYTTLTPRFNN
jgi:hypothetical protein